MKKFLSALAALAKLFLLHLPCILLLSLPAFLVGYAWCWIVGGFRAGELGFAQMTEDKTRQAVLWHFDITDPSPSEGGES